MAGIQKVIFGCQLVANYYFIRGVRDGCAFVLRSQDFDNIVGDRDYRSRKAHGLLLICELCEGVLCFFGFRQFCQCHCSMGLSL